LTFAPFLLLLLAAVVSISGWLSGRDLSYGEALAIYQDQSGSSTRLITLSAYALFIVCSGYVVVRMLGRNTISNKRILVYFLTYFMATIMVPFIFSENHYFNFGYLFSLVAVLAVLQARKVDRRLFYFWARVALGAMIFSSLLGAILAPDKSIAADYYGLAGWIPFRLYGIGMGATGLGVVSVAFLIFEFGDRRWSFLKISRMVMAIAALVLCQSKTAWIVSVYLLISYFLIGQMMSLKLSPARVGRARVMLFGGYFFVATILLVVLAQGLLSVGSFEGAESIEALTGRLYIWDVTLQVWLDFPIFGYGLGLWADEWFRNVYGGFNHGHNQLVHTLGAAGIVGLVGLVLYLVALFRAAVRVADETDVPLNLYVLLVTTALTDVPFLNNSVTDVFFILHLLVLMSIIGVRPSANLAYDHLNKNYSVRGSS
jgi:O-antigen ligase